MAKFDETRIAPFAKVGAPHQIRQQCIVCLGRNTYTHAHCTIPCSVHLSSHSLVTVDIKHLTCKRATPA